MKRILISASVLAVFAIAADFKECIENTECGENQICNAGRCDFQETILDIACLSDNDCFEYGMTCRNNNKCDFTF